jgi:N-acetylglucosaminyldiphosphoundecaprenol N-acetyl-beta-D-mannosaminyltransferase
MRERALDEIAPLSPGDWRGHRVRSAMALRVLIADGARRLLDIVVSALLLVILLPAACVRGWLGYRRGGRLFERVPVFGYRKRRFTQMRFAGPAGFGWWPTLLNVLRGDMAMAGPRAVPVGDAEVPGQPAERWECRPGLVSLYEVRGRVGVAYTAEREIDREFYYRESIGVNAGLLARAIASAPFAAAPPGRSLSSVTLLGVAVANVTMEEAVAWIVERAERRDPATVAFVNADCLNLAQGNAEYRATLAAAPLVLPDGIGLKYGCRILGTTLRSNVNGTDLFPLLCERLAHSTEAIYLLGGRPGVAEDAANEMSRRFPGLRVAGIHDGYYRPEEEAAIIDGINASGASLLLVGFGAPRQELWLSRHAARLTAPVRLGVGGLFDYYSGRIPRAPDWMRETGLEWVWRMMQEPGRLWRRYLIGNPLFLFRVWQQSRRETP